MTEEKKPARHRRHQVFSNPRVQMKIVVIFAVLALAFAVTNYLVGVRTLARIEENLEKVELTDSARTDAEVILAQERGTQQIQLIVLTVLGLVVLTSCGVYVSHLIGGPIYHIDKYMNDVVAGKAEPGEVKFRKRDFFHKLADSFNRFQRHAGILKDDDQG